MLDKKTQKFLSVVAGICADGSYKIIEKVELAKTIPDPSVLAQTVQFLKDNEMLDVKYIDETVYCMTVLPKGRVAVETPATGGNEERKANLKKLILVMLGAFLAAFVGGLLGGLIGKIC